MTRAEFAPFATSASASSSVSAAAKASSRMPLERASNSMQTAAFPLVLKGMLGLSLTNRG